MNDVIHIAAIVHLRHDTEGGAFCSRKLAAGKSLMEALRCLKSRISDVIYDHLVVDARAAEDLPRHIDTSDQALPEAAAAAIPCVRQPRQKTHEKSPKPPLGREPEGR
jgi:transposase